MQDRRGPFIDTGLAEMGGTDHFVGLEIGLSGCGPGDQPRHRNRIAANIQDPAAGHIVCIKPMLRHESRHGEAEARADKPHLADDAGFYQLHQFQRLRMQAIHEGFAEEGASLARSVDHRVGLEGGEAHRLFAKNVLAGFRCLDRPFGMARMRRGDVDRIDLRISNQRLVAANHARARKIRRVGSLRRIARAYGDKLAGSRMGDAAGECLGNSTGPDNAPADFSVHRQSPETDIFAVDCRRDVISPRPWKCRR